MADEPWVKPFPHPVGDYYWDATLEKWLPSTGEVTVGGVAAVEGPLTNQETVTSKVFGDLLATLNLLLTEMRVISILLNEGLNLKVELDELRDDESLTLEEEE